jgi:hypothetical protein
MSTDRTIYNNRPDIVMLDTAYLEEAAAGEVPEAYRLERKSL